MNLIEWANGQPLLIQVAVVLLLALVALVALFLGGVTLLALHRRLPGAPGAPLPPIEATDAELFQALTAFVSQTNDPAQAQQLWERLSPAERRGLADDPEIRPFIEKHLEAHTGSWPKNS